MLKLKARLTFNLASKNEKFMTKPTKKPEDIKDEPGAEDRFMRGIKRALETPPKPHEEIKAERASKTKAKVKKP
jgi:hypothetical protein